MTGQETDYDALPERERRTAKRVMPGAIRTLHESAYTALHIAIAAGDPRTEALYRLARDIDVLVGNTPMEKENAK